MLHLKTIFTSFCSSIRFRQSHWICCEYYVFICRGAVNNLDLFGRMLTTVMCGGDVFWGPRTVLFTRVRVGHLNAAALFLWKRSEKTRLTFISVFGRSEPRGFRQIKTNAGFGLHLLLRLRQLMNDIALLCCICFATEIPWLKWAREPVLWKCTRPPLLLLSCDCCDSFFGKHVFPPVYLPPQSHNLAEFGQSTR